MSARCGLPSWRLRSMPETCRRLRTMSDRTSWCVCNDARNKLLGKITRLILSLDPLKIAQIKRSSGDVRRELQGQQDTHEPPHHVVAQCCATAPRPLSGASATTAAFVDSGTPSASVIFLLPMPAAAIFSMAKSSPADRTNSHTKYL